MPQEPQAKNNEKSVDVLYRHFQRVAADDAGVVGVQQVAEQMCIRDRDKRITPCIDFGHLNARTLGGIQSRACLLYTSRCV